MEKFGIMNYEFRKEILTGIQENYVTFKLINQVK